MTIETVCGSWDFALLTIVSVPPDFTVADSGVKRWVSVIDLPGLTLGPPLMVIFALPLWAIAGTATAEPAIAAAASTARWERRDVIGGGSSEKGWKRTRANLTSARGRKQAVRSSTPCGW